MRILAAGFLLLVSALLTGCPTPEPQATATADAPVRPNIVFILLDDVGWNDVGYHGSEIATPNIDSLASAGMVLEQSRAFPICSPTRAALMTGRNPLQFGIDGPMENDAMLPTDLKLLPERLRQAGYATWLVGKWHLGMAHVNAAPHARGFDHFYGHLGGFIDYYTHVYFGGLDWQRNGESVREEGHATALLTAEAIRLLNEHASDKPFFLYLSYGEPHTPLQYPPAGGADYAGIADPDRRVFAQMTTHLDTYIGRFTQALRSRGLYDNTLIVFMSDNGGNLKAGGSNGDLRGSKGSALEGGVRVPTFVSWPNVIGAGQVSDVPVFAHDWPATLLEVAGSEDPSPAAEDGGTSVWGALIRGEVVERKSPVVVGSGRSKAVYDWPWKLLRTKGPAQRPPEDQLFNLVDDPLERRDLATQHPDIATTLAAELDALPQLASKGARGPAPETLFRDASGAFVYDIRMPETREPWAESATAQ